MFFKRRNTSSNVVHTYSDACDLLRHMGLKLSTPQSSSGAITSLIVNRNGMKWVFSGDDEGFIISREIIAPDNWEMDAFISWVHKKSFVVAVYNPKKNTFLLACHVLSEGGVVIQNLARLVANFDSNIRDFLISMKIDESQLKTLE